MFLIFCDVKKKNRRPYYLFKHNTVHLNWILLSLKYFFYVLTFPNFQGLRANFPNSEGPTPIRKILKRNTDHYGSSILKK